MVAVKCRPVHHYSVTDIFRYLLFYHSPFREFFKTYTVLVRPNWPKVVRVAKKKARVATIKKLRIQLFSFLCVNALLSRLEFLRKKNNLGSLIRLK